MEKLVCLAENFQPFGRSLLEPSDLHEKKEYWHIVEAYSEDGNVIPGIEDELYFVDNVVVWSRGQGQAGRRLMKSYRMDSTVLDVFWCKFSGGINPDDSTQPSLELSSKSPCLCVVQKHSMSVFTLAGSNFNFMLPFPVANAWSVPGGALLQSTLSSENCEHLGKANFPRLFFLVHPLEEVKPLAWKEAGESVEKCRSTIAILENMEAVHAFSDMPLVLMKERKANGKFALYRLEHLPPRKVLPASELDIEDVDLFPSFASLKDNATPLFQNGTKASSAASSKLSSAASPLHLPLSVPDSGVLSYSSGGSGVSPAVGLSTQRRRSTQLRRRLQTYSNTGSGGTVTRSRDLGDAASPMPLMRGPSRVRGARRNARQAATTRVAATTSAVSSPLSRATRGVYTGSSSIHTLSRHPLTASSASSYTPTRTPGFGISTPGQSRMVGLNLPFTPLGLASDPGSSEDKIYMDACISLEWMDMKHLLAESPITSASLYCDITGQMYVCFMQRDIKKFIYIPVSSDGHVIGLPIALCNIKSALPLNSLGVLCVADDDGLHFNTVTSHCCLLSDSLPDSLHLSDPVGSRLSLCLPDGLHYRLPLPEPITDPILSNCCLVLKQTLSTKAFSQFCVRFYATLSMVDNIFLSKQWECFRKSLCECLALHSLPSETAMDSTCSASVTDTDLINMVCSSSHNSTPVPLTLLRLTASEDSLYTVGNVYHHLHLVYEETKLDIANKKATPYLMCLLVSISHALQLPDYTRYYITDHPTLALQLVPFIHPNPVSYRHVPQLPVSITEHLHGILDNSAGDFEWPCQKVCIRSAMMCHLMRAHQRFLHCNAFGSSAAEADTAAHPSISRSLSSTGPGCEVDKQLKSQAYVQLADDIARSELSESILESLPIGYRLLVEQMLDWCRQKSMTSLPLSVCHLLGRTDYVRQSRLSAKSDLAQAHRGAAQQPSDLDGIHDGLQFMDMHLSLLFSKDRRMSEVGTLLESVRPVLITVEQKAGVTDHDHQQEQIRQLMSLCQRTFALPVGRGAATLRSSRCIPTQSMAPPVLCRSGKTPLPRSVVVKLREEESHELEWPFFHNGVASGLALCGDQLDAKWILHNQPSSDELQQEHGGFLFALGLNGQLGVLHNYQIYMYLTELNVPTTIGLLLGISAMHCASRHQLTLRVLSVHIAPLRPPNSQLVKVEPLVQIAAIHGVGLVFMESANQHLCSILIQEIGGLPEHTDLKDLKKFRRHAYSLACGASLGMIMLGQGEGQTATDLQLTGRLLSLLEGHGQNAKMLSADGPGPAKSSTLDPDFDLQGRAIEGLVLDRDFVDVHCTAPAAVLALTLMYLKTNSSEAAAWLKAPDTIQELCSMRPDVLLVRVTGHHLVLWDSISEREQWFLSHVHRFEAFSRLHADVRRRGGPYESCLLQATYAYKAGLCLAIGLRFAGTRSEEAFQTIYRSCSADLHMLVPLKCPEEIKRVVHVSLLMSLLAMSMVVAGTGDVRVLRMCRLLHSHTSDSSFTYGCHMLSHMALGFAFLGGARFSFSRTNKAIASLLVSVYPLLPQIPSDNSCHLQALRHLYVLAAEPRLLAPVDADSEEACSVPIIITMKNGKSMAATAPTILPDLEEIALVQTNSPQYWPVRMDFANDFLKHRTMIQEYRGVLFVKRKPPTQTVPRPLTCDAEFSGLVRSWQQLALQSLGLAAVDSSHVSSVDDSLAVPQIPSFLHEKHFRSFVYTFLEGVLKQVKAGSSLDFHSLQQLRLIFAACSVGSHHQGLVNDSVVSVVKACVEQRLRQDEKLVAGALTSLVEDKLQAISSTDWPSICAVVHYHRLSLSKRKQLQPYLPVLARAVVGDGHVPLSLLVAGASPSPSLLPLVTPAFPP